MKKVIKKVRKKGTKNDLSIHNRASNSINVRSNRRNNSRVGVGLVQSKEEVNDLGNNKTDNNFQALEDPYGPANAEGRYKLTPIEQALENWKSRQANVPWWWLSFSRNGKHCGVVIIQGWNFADAVNASNKLGLSPVKAAIYGEELSDLWEPREGDKGKWTNRLLGRKESGEVFGEVVKVTEAGLYESRKGDVKFK